MFYLACLGFIKTSVCWFYTRIGDKTLTRMSLIMMGIVGTQATVFVMVAAFQCRPIPKAYSLPIKVLLRLQMPVKQKLALGFILCLGLL